MNKAVKGYIACDNLKISPDNTVTVSGQVTNSLYDILTDKKGVRLFPSYLVPLFQNESLCENFSYENEFDLHKNESVGGTYFYMDCFARTLVFITQKQWAARK